MLSLQVVPRSEVDAYRLLRDKIAHGAQTWFWKNKKKTRLTHKKDPRAGYIEVGSADGVLVAEIHATKESDTYFFAEKFIGRLVAWFRPELAAINIQFREESIPPARRRKRSTR